MRCSDFRSVDRNCTRLLPDRLLVNQGRGMTCLRCYLHVVVSAGNQARYAYLRKPEVSFATKLAAKLDQVPTTMELLRPVRMVFVDEYF